MRNHPKVKALRKKFANGYGIWSFLLEYLTDADGNEFEHSDFQYDLMAGDIGYAAEEIKGVVDYCLNPLQMLFIEEDFIFSKSLDTNLKPVYEKRKTAKLISESRERKNGKFVAAVPVAIPAALPAAAAPLALPESIVTAKPEKKKKAKKEFIPPTQAEVEQYCVDHGFTKELGARAFKGYHENGWKDSQNNPVQNWKMKMQHVWFNDINKAVDANQQGDSREWKTV